MAGFKVTIRRLESESNGRQLSPEEFNEIKRSEHEERAKLTHAVTDALGVKVKDWSQIDTQRVEEMREEVDLDLVINSREQLIALILAFKVWLDRKKLQRVSVEERGGGKRISLEGITIEQVKSFVDELGPFQNWTEQGF